MKDVNKYNFFRNVRVMKKKKALAQTPSPPRFGGSRATERQFKHRLKMEYLNRVWEIRNRQLKTLLPPIEPNVPRLDLSFARDLVIESESEDSEIIPFDQDPFHLLEGVELPGGSDDSYSVESFSNGSDGEPHKRIRHRKRIMVSEASAHSLVTDSSDSSSSRNSVFSLSSDSESEETPIKIAKPTALLKLRPLQVQSRPSNVTRPRGRRRIEKRDARRTTYL